LPKKIAVCSTFTRECKKGRGLNIFQANSVILWQAPRDSMKSAVKPGLPVRIISRQEGMGQGLKSGILPKVSIPGRMRRSYYFAIGRSCTEFQICTPSLSVRGGRWGELYVAMDQECILASTKELIPILSGNLEHSLPSGGQE